MTVDKNKRVLSCEEATEFIKILGQHLEAALEHCELVDKTLLNLSIKNNKGIIGVSGELPFRPDRAKLCVALSGIVTIKHVVEEN